MATQQFEASKELILQLTRKNRMNTESDIKGVVPGEYSMNPAIQAKSFSEVIIQN